MLIRECFALSSRFSENGFVEMSDRFAATTCAKSVHKSAKREERSRWVYWVSDMDPFEDPAASGPAVRSALEERAYPPPWGIGPLAQATKAKANRLEQRRANPAAVRAR
jgi:hypothetical protein